MFKSEFAYGRVVQYTMIFSNFSQRRKSGVIEHLNTIKLNLLLLCRLCPCRLLSHNSYSVLLQSGPVMQIRFRAVESALSSACQYLHVFIWCVSRIRLRLSVRTSISILYPATRTKRQPLFTIQLLVMLKQRNTDERRTSPRIPNHKSLIL